jgi:hypothetical protein
VYCVWASCLSRDCRKGEGKGGERGEEIREEWREEERGGRRGKERRAKFIKEVKK